MTMQFFQQFLLQRPGDSVSKPLVEVGSSLGSSATGRCFRCERGTFTSQGSCSQPRTFRKTCNENQSSDAVGYPKHWSDKMFPKGHNLCRSVLCTKFLEAAGFAKHGCLSCKMSVLEALYGSAEKCFTGQHTKPNTSNKI